MNQPTQQSRVSEYYCAYRLQAQKRIGRGETVPKLERCLKQCQGYNNKCENYTPMRDATFWMVK